LNGWSVSNNRHIDKIWRMFRLDRVLSVTFTGSFYRLPPTGYNMNDRGMRGGIIAKADFDQIRKNQQDLVKTQKIQNKDDVTLGSETIGTPTVKVRNTDSQLDLTKPMDNPYINNLKDTTNLRISFLKSIFGNKYIAILGALGSPGNTVRVMDEKGTNLGNFKIMDSTTGDVIKKITRVKGNTIFDLFIFINKI
jgi:hypothetical protein